MQNTGKTNEIAYKRAQRRVKEIKNYYYFLAGYALVATLLLYKNYDGNIFNFNRDYVLFMLGLQGVFLIGYGIYLFVPYFHDWEERKTEELAKKYNSKNN